MIELCTYPNSGKRVTYFDWYKIDEKYDLENPGRVKEKLLQIANIIIHGFVFMPASDEDSELAILFNSDQTRATPVQAHENVHYHTRRARNVLGPLDAASIHRSSRARVPKG